MHKRARGLMFCLSIHLRPYFEGIRSEVPSETACEQAYRSLCCLIMQKVQKSHVLAQLVFCFIRLKQNIHIRLLPSCLKFFDPTQRVDVFRPLKPYLANRVDPDEMAHFTISTGLHFHFRKHLISYIQ